MRGSDHITHASRTLSHNLFTIIDEYLPLLPSLHGQPDMQDISLPQYQQYNAPSNYCGIAKNFTPDVLAARPRRNKHGRKPAHEPDGVYVESPPHSPTQQVQLYRPTQQAQPRPPTQQAQPHPPQSPAQPGRPYPHLAAVGTSGMPAGPAPGTPALPDAVIGDLLKAMETVLAKHTGQPLSRGSEQGPVPGMPGLPPEQQRVSGNSRATQGGRGGPGRGTGEAGAPAPPAAPLSLQPVFSSWTLPDMSKGPVERQRLGVDAVAQSAGGRQQGSLELRSLSVNRRELQGIMEGSLGVAGPGIQGVLGVAGPASPGPSHGGVVASAAPAGFAMGGGWQSPDAPGRLEMLAGALPLQLQQQQQQILQLQQQLQQQQLQQQQQLLLQQQQQQLHQLQQQLQQQQQQQRPQQQLRQAPLPDLAPGPSGGRPDTAKSGFAGRWPAGVGGRQGG